MTDVNIFYSWQSDLPNPTNRGFIQDVLEKAARSIRTDDTIHVEPVIDRDTQGVPGSPNISTTIFSKIEESAVFVCDVTIVEKNESRSFPNPNVLIELGYALKALGWDRVILVQNTHYGPVKSLPFDLRQHLVIAYNLSPSSAAEEKKAAKKTLSSKLEGAIRTIFSSFETSLPEESTFKEQCCAIVRQNDKQSWLSLLEKYSEPIIDLLIDWKQRWEPQVSPELHESPRKYDAWQKSFADAVDICLPGFVPAFSSVELGNVEFWNISIRLLRQIARLKGRMGGGLVIMAEIGPQLLSVAGAIGIAIAIRRHQLKLIKEWAFLKITPYDNNSNEQYSWINLRETNWPYMPYQSKQNKPFDFLVSYYDANTELQEFFTDKNKFEQSLLFGNFILSLLEFSIYIKDPNNINILLQRTSNINSTVISFSSLLSY